MILSRTLKIWLVLTLGIVAQQQHGANAFAFAPPSVSPFSTTTTLYNEPKGGGGHNVQGSGPKMTIDPEEAKIQAAFAEHQQNAPKLGWATDVRTLVEYNHGFAVMSTNSKS